MSTTQPIKIEVESRYRVHTGVRHKLTLLVTALALASALYTILDVPLYLRFLPHFLPPQTGSLTIGLFMFLAFLHFPATKGASRERVPWYDWLLAILSLPLPLWVSVNYMRLITEGLDMFPPPYLVALGVLMGIVTLEAVRRSMGLPITILVIFLFIYPLVGSHMPGIFFTRSWGFERVIGHLFYGEEGLLGLPLSVLMRIIIGFFVLTALFRVFGGTKFINDFALAITGGVRGGPGKVAIIASALFGSVSGSALANTAATGSITIPLMIRTGYRRHYAAAIEAVASPGGQIMPPVMGTVAFIMAEFLEIPYAHIVVIAFIPALLYFGSIFLQADFQAAKMGLKGIPKGERPLVWGSLKQGVPLILALGTLIYFLIILRWSPGKSALIASVACFLGAFIYRETRPNFRKLGEFIETVGKMLTELIPMMSALGIMVGAIMLTGVGGTFTRMLTGMGGENIPLLMLAAAGACFILGMGVPVIAVYMLTALFVAPAFVPLGVPLIAVHFALLYWSILSFITPPVALTAILAASIAGANPMRTGLRAMALGATAYFLPVLILLQPALLLYGDAGTIVFSIVCTILTIAFLAMAIEGYMPGSGTIPWWRRIILFVAAGLMAIAVVTGSLLIAALGLIIGMGNILGQVAWTRLARGSFRK
ncbi:MAG: Sialic acid TRAP transporter permease protein SiaT [Dehalococcoidia bacterium]|nr:Sialic acid TRAP transporter permease protein SiaT [Bacillota bacterium]